MTGPKSGRHVHDDAVLFIVTAPARRGIGPQVAGVAFRRRGLVTERHEDTGGLMGHICRNVRVTPWVGIGVAASERPGLSGRVANVHAARPLVFFLASPAGRSLLTR
jgi:hypothetical protein